MSSKKKPKVVAQPDPKVEAEKAANEAAAKANMEAATRKKRKADSSLLSTAGGARGNRAPGAEPASLLSSASGKDTLGS